MKIRTTSQLLDALDADLIWRKKELTQYKFLLEGARTRADRHTAILRGCVTLLYAHWEGFTRKASLAYLEYLASQRLRYDQLAPNFLALAARKLLRRGGEANAIAVHIRVTEFFRSQLKERSTIPYRDGVSTRSNLNADVLEEILLTLGLDRTPFVTKRILIDEGLLASRNTIAHGEDVRITEARYQELYREVLAMVEELKLQIGNAAVYRRFAI